MAKLAKPRDEYTLLDSLIMEGLAEMAVAEYVGKPYVASWNTQYPDDLLTESWHQYFKENLSIPITNPVHDQLLYGNRIGKAMIGYALGYFIIRQYKRLNRSFPSPILFTPVRTDYKNGAGKNGRIVEAIATSSLKKKTLFKKA